MSTTTMERIKNGALVEWLGRTCRVHSLGVDPHYPECGPEYRLESEDRAAARYLVAKDELEAGNPYAARVPWTPEGDAER